MKGIRIVLTALAMVTISSFALCQDAGTKNKELERQLADIDQQWEWGARPNRTDFLKQLWTDQWVEEVPWVPGFQTKAEAVGRLNRLADSNRKPGEGNFVDEFKLRAVYGNVALATDRRTNIAFDAQGQVIVRPYRSLLVFVKEKGKWKPAGGALTLIVAP